MLKCKNMVISDNFPAGQLDVKWYERFKALVFEDYEKLNGEGVVRDAQEKAFLANEIVNPILDYPELALFDGASLTSQLTELKSDIESEETNETVKRLYVAKIDETLTMVRMLEAAKIGDDKLFCAESSNVYGDLDQKAVDYVLSIVRAKAKYSTVHGDEEKVAAANRLLAILPEVDEDYVDESIAMLPPLTPSGGKVTDAAIAAEAFEALLKKLQIDDWTVLIDEPKGITNFSVSQEYKTIHIPGTAALVKRSMSNRKLHGLIIHEIGAHVVRRFNGAKSKLRLLGLGLDRYIKGEEGVATYYEQKVTGARSFAGTARYFSIALATGRCDGVPRDFRETFEVLCDYRLLYKRERVSRRESVRILAYNDSVRIFRGTSCRTKGAVYYKDTAYFSNRAIWQLVKDNPEIEATFRYGKFDPTNEDHVTALIELGIL